MVECSGNPVFQQKKLPDSVFSLDRIVFFKINSNVNMIVALHYPKCTTERSMNKSELIKTLAEENAISVDEATIVVNTFFDSIRQALLQDQRVEIRGLGSFKIKEYQGYSGRNPKTGEVVSVAPKKLPFFRAGKELKEYINS